MYTFDTQCGGQVLVDEPKVAEASPKASRVIIPALALPTLSQNFSPASLSLFPTTLSYSSRVNNAAHPSTMSAAMA